MTPATGVDSTGLPGAGVLAAAAAGVLTSPAAAGGVVSGRAGTRPTACVGIEALAAGPDAAAESVMVLKTTCGTVTVCVVVLPEARVRVNVTTVIGNLTGGAVGFGASPWPPVTGFDGTAGADGVGTSVIVLGTPVQILEILALALMA